jgi:hypothetical protein
MEKALLAFRSDLSALEETGREEAIELAQECEQPDDEHEEVRTP